MRRSTMVSSFVLMLHSSDHHRLLQATRLDRWRGDVLHSSTFTHARAGFSPISTSHRKSSFALQLLIPLTNCPACFRMALATAVARSSRNQWRSLRHDSKTPPDMHKKGHSSATSCISCFTIEEVLFLPAC